MTDAKQATNRRFSSSRDVKQGQLKVEGRKGRRTNRLLWGRGSRLLRDLNDGGDEVLESTKMGEGERSAWDRERGEREGGKERKGGRSS